MTGIIFTLISIGSLMFFAKRANQKNAARVVRPGSTGALRHNLTSFGAVAQWMTVNALLLVILVVMT